MTQWTAFIAVSKQKYNPNATQTPTQAVPLPMVKGVTQHAYGNPGKANSSTRKKSVSASVGSGIPEPAMIFELLLVMIILGWFIRKQLQA